MKKIINGKMYNTETAKEIGEYWNRLGANDFDFCDEYLYEKKTGEFFLYGEYFSDRRIVPLTNEEARSWCEEHLDADVYIEVFGEPEE